MKFVLALHCETDWNDPVNGRLQGHTDIPLNSKGREQAKSLAEALGADNFGVTKIVCSDLRRSYETAEIISEKLGVGFTKDARLKECSFGKLEGTKKSELNSDNLKDLFTATVDSPDVWHGSYRDYDFSKIGGETSEGVAGRQLELMEELRSSGVPLLIGHSTAMNTLLVKLGQRLIRRSEVKTVEI